MPEFLKKLYTQIKDIFTKLDKTKKIIIVTVGGVIFVSLIVLFSVSGTKGKVILFSDLSVEDFAKVSKKLDELGYNYSSSGTSAISVIPEQKEQILTKLAQEDMIPAGIPGWKLFDISKWTETDRELDVKYMRALRDSIKRHIESLKNVEKADVEIASITKDELFTEDALPYTAAVTLYAAPGFDKFSKKEIRGIMYLVSRAVGSKLKPEMVTVTDAYGNIISEFDTDEDKAKIEYSLVDSRRKYQEQLRVQLLRDIKQGLERIYSADRIQIIALNMNLNWDEISEDKEEYSPIELEPDNPTTPYSERKIKDSLVLSEKSTSEDFQGHGWNPEGPAGTESNTPPGYKASDDQFSKYNKKENIVNNVVNKTLKKIKRAPYSIEKLSVSVAIDGKQSLPILPDGEYDLDPLKKPVYEALTEDELLQVKDIVKKAINFNEARGDQVAVQNIQFDRTKQWENIRLEFLKKERMRKMLLASLIGLFALILGVILFRFISKELERRRKLREEQLALEQERMREAALRAAEEEGVDIELSLEEKARLELQENAMNLAKERPDEVAQLLKTWLAEE